MRFRKYRNRYNDDERIYSLEDVREMSMKHFLDNQDSLLSQYGDIGLPTNSELAASPNTRYVEPFTNELGEQDGGYWESIMDDGILQKFNNVGLVNNRPILQGYVSKDEIIPEENPVQTLNNLPSVSNAITPEVMLSAYSDLGLLPDLEEVNDPIKNEQQVEHKKTFLEKYKGLTHTEILTKGLSKVLLPWTAQQYYGHAMHLADGEEPSLYMKLNNDFYKFGDLPESEQKDFYRKQAAKMYKLDINDPNLDEKIKDAPIVVSKPNSSLSKKIKNSQVLKDYVVEHYDEIMNNKDANGSVEFPAKKNFNLFATIHKGDVTIPADSENTRLEDIFNFEKWKEIPFKKGCKPIKFEGQNLEGITNQVQENIGKFLNNALYNLGVNLNNLGFAQQEANQLANYILSSNISLSEKDIKKIMREYTKNRVKTAK